jgi:hypothetical protein
MNSLQPSRGLEGLLAGLESRGARPRVDQGVVQFTLFAAAGAFAGTELLSGIGIDEVDGWPLIPPHWVHLPGAVHILITNTQPSSVPGWLKHSRNIAGWGDGAEPTQAWLAHVRSVLRESE